MAAVHLIEGPVGAGKSTFAAQLGTRLTAPRLILDEWMVVLFSPDRPETDFMSWYAQCKNRCIEQIWRVSTDMMDSDIDVILELGLVQHHDRQSFYDRIDAAGCELNVYVLDTPEAVRLRRVRERNASQGDTYQMTVSDEVFELANRMWQPPDEDEIRERNIQFIGTST
jgi:predicted kinase